VKIPKIFQFIIKYVAPAYLIVIFVGFCTNNLPGYIETITDANNPGHRNAQLAWLVIGGVIALLVAATAVGARRWRAQGLDLDGARDAEGR
jgi:uncharacterized membrane protein YhaH (DUF805 family)